MQATVPKMPLLALRAFPPYIAIRASTLLIGASPEFCPETVPSVQVRIQCGSAEQCSCGLHAAEPLCAPSEGGNPLINGEMHTESFCPHGSTHDRKGLDRLTRLRHLLVNPFPEHQLSCLTHVHSEDFADIALRV
jgi:hypothetical protein